MKLLALLISFTTLSAGGLAASLRPELAPRAALPQGFGGPFGGFPGSQDGDGQAVEGDTLVLFEIGGIRGHECMTFRNNGEMVDAACVHEAADRQMTPTKRKGIDVLRVQRSFTAGFRPDLVGVEACVGSNGTHFKAFDCDANNVKPVTFTADRELRTADGACASGHDDKAQVTVDTTGRTCAKFTVTKVQPTPP